MQIGNPLLKRSSRARRTRGQGKVRRRSTEQERPDPDADLLASIPESHQRAIRFYVRFARSALKHESARRRTLGKWIKTCKTVRAKLFVMGKEIAGIDFDLQHLQDQTLVLLDRLIGQLTEQDTSTTLRQTRETKDLSAGYDLRQFAALASWWAFKNIEDQLLEAGITSPRAGRCALEIIRANELSDEFDPAWDGLLSVGDKLVPGRNHAATRTVTLDVVGIRRDGTAEPSTTAQRHFQFVLSPECLEVAERVERDSAMASQPPDWGRFAPWIFRIGLGGRRRTTSDRILEKYESWLRFFNEFWPECVRAHEDAAQADRLVSEVIWPQVVTATGKRLAKTQKARLKSAIQSSSSNPKSLARRCALLGEEISDRTLRRRVDKT